MLDVAITETKNPANDATGTEPAKDAPTEGGSRFSVALNQDRTKNGLTDARGHASEPPRTGSDNLSLHSKEVPKAVSLDDIRVGRLDGCGNEITAIYAAQGDEYAIYQAGEVMVHFADDVGKAQNQRKLILPISAARAEVMALAQGQARRNVCDRQVAYAIQLALDGDSDGAKAMIGAAKAAVVATRAAAGRFQYLKWSFATAGMLIGAMSVASLIFPFREASSDLWLAAKAGLVGAAFSIALGIRSRTVALDTDPLDNITDGALRLSIGIIAAGVLLLLFASRVVPTLKIGEADLTTGTLTWQLVLIIGFVAGFLERLVPDLLDKRNPAGNSANGAAAYAK